MVFWKKYPLVRGYFHYWLHAVNEHSLHAPFIYRLYCDVIRADLNNSAYSSIEAVRQDLLQSKNFILIEDIGAKSLTSSQSRRSIRAIARHSLSSPKFSRLLYRLLAYIEADYVVELGTSLGINTLYLSAARPSAQVFTLEGAPALADRAEDVFSQQNRTNIKLVRGNIDETLPPLLQQLPRVDLAYLDANHRYEPTVCYFDQITKKAHSNSTVVIDDIYWSAGMQQAWQAIRKHPAVTLSIDLFDAGLVFFRPLPVRQHYTLMF